MKTLKFLFLALVSSLMISSCEEEMPNCLIALPLGTLDSTGSPVPPESPGYYRLDVEDEGMRYTIKAGAYGEWEVENSVDWISVSPTSGKDRIDVELTVAPNRGPERQAEVKFIAVNAFNMVVIQVGAGDSVKEFINLGHLQNFKDGEVVAVRGQVVANYERGFIISDGGSNVHIYGGEKATLYDLGSNVEIVGVKTTYRGVPELIDLESVKVRSSFEVTHPEPFPCTAETIPEILGRNEVLYIDYSGELFIEDGWYYIRIEGTDIVGKVSFPLPGFTDGLVAGSMVNVKGYFINVATLKTGLTYMSTVVSSIEVLE